MSERDDEELSNQGTPIEATPSNKEDVKPEPEKDKNTKSQKNIKNIK